MTRFVRSRWCRFTALLLALAVLHTVPGLASYSALAAAIKTAPVAGVTALPTVRVGMPLGSAALMPSGSAALNAPALTGSLNMALAPRLAAPANAQALTAASAIEAARVVPAAHALPALQQAPAAVAADAAAPAVTAQQGLEQAVSAVQAPAASAASRDAAAMPVIGRLFDGFRRSRPGDVPPVSSMPNEGAKFTPLAVPAAADAPRPSNDVPSAPNDGGNKAPRQLPVGLGLALAIGGGVGAWFAAPALIPFLSYALAHIPFLSVPALPLLASKIAVTVLGSAAGLSLYSYKTWFGFPADLKNTSIGAARTTFRFWGSFGMIFDAVIRGKSTDAAQKAELPANILKYPLGAWLFVLLGYVAAPIAFVIGAAWRIVGTPILAAWRGAVDVAVGFFPWLRDFIEFALRVIKNILPFVGGLVWGLIRGVFFAGAAGAIAAAAPIARDAVAASYEPKTVPGWVGYRLIQLVGVVATVAVGALGAVAGVAVGPVHALLSAVRTAFKWSDVSEKADAFFGRYENAVSEDKAFNALLERGSKTGGSESLNARTARLANGALSGAALVLAYPFISLATLIRGLNAAFRDVKVERYSSDFERNMPAKGEERPVSPVAVNALVPAVAGALGAAAGVYLFTVFAPGAIIFGGLAGLVQWALAGLAGFGAGLALSQVSALLAIPGRAVTDAKRGGSLAWQVWDGTGAAAATAVFGTEKAAPVGRLLTAIPGALAAVVFGARGVVYAVATGGVKAGWTGFMEVVRRFIPALKRLLNFAVKVLRNIVPFVFGFIWGTLVGVFKVGGVAAITLFKPVAEAFSAEDDARTKPNEAQIGFGLLLGLTLLPLAAVVFAGGFVLGVVAGLPIVLTYSVSRAIKWSRPTEKSDEFFRAWERKAIDRAGQRTMNAVSGIYEGVGAESPIWRVYVRAASALIGSPVSAVTLFLAGYKNYLGSFAEAKAIAAGTELASIEEPKLPETPAVAPRPLNTGSVNVVVPALLGSVGIAAGIVSIFTLGLPWLAGLAGWTLWAGYAAVFAGLPLLGAAAGFAVSQPVFWKNILPLGATHAKGGFVRSYEYWKNSGDAALEGIAGVKRGSKLTALHRLAGGVTGLVWSVAGALYGAGAAFLIGAYTGARQVVYEILPALRVAFETAMKVLRRIVPFLFGLVAGVVGGVVGSAAFGALLLGRPWFKDIVAQDFKHEGFLPALGNLFLKAVAFVAGVVFGLAGLVIGVVVAAPYALTSAVALAFRWADIGGPAQRYFDHWSFGALREEMRRINQLTAKLKFDDAAEGQDPSLASGWIRVANVLAVTLVGTIAAGFAGLVGFFRSLGTAFKSARSGGPIPTPTVDEQSRREWDRTWSRAGRTALGFWSWGLTGASIGLALMWFTSWTPLGLAGWLLVGAAAGLGVLAALGVGAVIAMIALMVWIGGQLR